MKWTPSWARQLDELKKRARRAVMSRKGISDDQELVDAVRKTGSITLDEALERESVQETMRRGFALMSEHELSIKVTGCCVSLQAMETERGLMFMLAISRGDKQPHGATWDRVPPKFEKLRKHLGAPEKPIALGPVAVHWSWKIEETHAGVVQQ